MVSESKGPWFNLPSFRRLKIRFSAFLVKFTPLFTCIHFPEPFHEQISLHPNGAFPRKYNQWDLTISTSFSFLLVWVKPLSRRLLWEASLFMGGGALRPWSAQQRWPEEERRTQVVSSCRGAVPLRKGCCCGQGLMRRCCCASPWAGSQRLLLSHH